MSDRCQQCGEVPNPDGSCACPKQQASNSQASPTNSEIVLCPLCHDPLYGGTQIMQVIENVHIGKVHLACILLHKLDNKPGPL